MNGRQAALGNMEASRVVLRGGDHLVEVIFWNLTPWALMLLMRQV